MRRHAVFACAMVLLLTMAVPVGATRGQSEKELPFHAEFAGYLIGFNEDRDMIEARCADPDNTWAITSFDGWGEATHLGPTYVYAEHCSYEDGYGEGLLTMTADNGDVLKATYRDGVSLSGPPLIGFADYFTFTDGGSGRFVSASGGGVEQGVLNFTTGAFSVYMEGTIVYDASNRRHR
ncbi:MAG: hypothetical protein OEO77_00035 [Acidimicrobiia bacterium]|nr:hypothetical protein [Acidimicrobiia bacterium]